MITIDEARGYYRGAESAHDFDHVLRVLALAERLARAEGADVEIVRAAVLLHDSARGRGRKRRRSRATGCRARPRDPARARRRAGASGRGRARDCRASFSQQHAAANARGENPIRRGQTRCDWRDWHRARLRRIGRAPSAFVERGGTGRGRDARAAQRELFGGGGIRRQVEPDSGAPVHRDGASHRGGTARVHGGFFRAARARGERRDLI